MAVKTPPRCSSYVSEAEERKCWWVVSVSTLYPSLSFSVFNEYEAPRAKALKPSALPRLPLHSVLSFSSTVFTVCCLSSPSSKKYIFVHKVAEFEANLSIFIIIIMFIFGIKNTKMFFLMVWGMNFLLLISNPAISPLNHLLTSLQTMFEVHIPREMRYFNLPMPHISTKENCWIMLYNRGLCHITRMMFVDLKFFIKCLNQQDSSVSFKKAALDFMAGGVGVPLLSAAEGNWSG